MQQQEAPQGNRRRRPLTETSNDYYDSDDEKGHRGGPASDKIYGSACSLGQFFLNPCLCIWMMVRMTCQRQYVTKIRSRLKPIHALLLVPLVIFMRFILTDQSRMRPHPLRPRSDAQINNLQIMIPYLDSRNLADLGGWFSPVPFYSAKKSSQLTSDKLVDFGPFVFKPPTLQRFSRVTNPKDYEKYEDERSRELNRMDLEPNAAKYDHDDEQDYQECRRPNWKTAYYPNCNAFHEMGMGRIYDAEITSLVDKDQDSYLFSHGYYRDAWLVDVVEKREAAVLKTLRMKHEFTLRTFANVRRDAIVMERFTSSSYIVNMFGHCAASLSVEPVAFEIEEYIVVRV